MLFIDGHFVDKAEAGRDDIEWAIATASRLAPDYGRTAAHERAALCEAVAQGIHAQRAELAERICQEAKKPLQYARLEVDRAEQTFRFAVGEARLLGGELVPMDAAPGAEGRIGLALRVPRGPIAAITPFNFPLNLVAHKIAPALACGAPVVLKPAPETPETALDLARIVDRAGAPRGALAVVPASVADASLFIEDERLRVLSFTGSATVGWALKARAGQKHVILELGGDAAAILEPDVELDPVLPRLVTGAFAYAGQVCISLQRIFVHDSRASELERKLVAATEKLAVVGDPRRPDVMVGPLIRTRDADRVQAWIDEAVGAGARLLCGGRREGDTLWPTILADVPETCRIMAEEVFGPVVVLGRYRSFDEALAFVNASHYGLQAGVFTHDQRKLMQAFRTLQVGAVIHNDVPTFRADHMPYGGTKSSGLGREGVHYAVIELTEPRLLVMQG